MSAMCIYVHLVCISFVFWAAVAKVCKLCRREPGLGGKKSRLSKWKTVPRQILSRRLLQEGHSVSLTGSSQFIFALYFSLRAYNGLLHNQVVYGGRLPICIDGDYTAGAVADIERPVYRLIKGKTRCITAARTTKKMAKLFSSNYTTQQWTLNKTFIKHVCFLFHEVSNFILLCRILLRQTLFLILINNRSVRVFHRFASVTWSFVVI